MPTKTIFTYTCLYKYFPPTGKNSFPDVHAQAKQFERFRIDEMARQMATISPRLWCFIGSLISPKYAAEDLLDVNLSDLDDVDNLEVSDSQVQDFGGMILELIEDKPTREARRIANEKAILTLVFVILF